MTTTDNATEPAKESKKRGRPPTGKALTGSDRQARRLAKLEAEGKTVLPQAVVSFEVQQALMNYIRFKDMTLGDALDRIVRDRLLRKRSGRRRKRSPETNHSPQ